MSDFKILKILSDLSFGMIFNFTVTIIVITFFTIKSYFVFDKV